MVSKTYKFGSRTQLIDHNTPILGHAVELFLDSYNGVSATIPDIVCKEYKRKVERVVVFAEFWGANTFAGTHDPHDPHFLTLFDVSVYKKGLIPAEKFVELFGDQDWSAKVVYEGDLNQTLIDNVRHGKYQVDEGVVCKGIGWMAKIKTFEYLNRLKNKYGDDWEKYGE